MPKSLPSFFFSFKTNKSCLIPTSNFNTYLTILLSQIPCNLSYLLWYITVKSRTLDAHSLFVLTLSTIAIKITSSIFSLQMLIGTPEMILYNTFLNLRHEYLDETLYIEIEPMSKLVNGRSNRSAFLNHFHLFTFIISLFHMAAI